MLKELLVPKFILARYKKQFNKHVKDLMQKLFELDEKTRMHARSASI